jgi:hypothetical protein
VTERALKTVLALIALYHVAMGLLALVAPGTFFDEIGRYGVENTHYVGDVGAFMLAFGIAVGVAAARPSWRAPVLWLGALWYGFHALNHLFDTDEARTEGRGWADTLLIAFGAVAAGWLARVSERMGAEEQRAADGRAGP